MLYRSSVIFSLLIAVLCVLSSCEEDEAAGLDNDATVGIQPTLAAPTLEKRGVPQRDAVSMAIMVASDQASATVHYTFFEESEHEGAPTPQALLDDSFKTIEMNGATIKVFNFGASSQTKYFIYALIQIGDEVSEVVLLEATTE